MARATPSRRGSEEPHREELLAEIAGLRERLQVAEATLGAIRDGEVDAFVVYHPHGEAVYTLDTEELIQQLRVISDTLPIFVAYVDRDQRYRFCNRKYEAWFGHPVKDLQGRHLRDVLGKAAYERVRGYVEAALAGTKATFDEWIDFPHGRSCMHGTYVPHVHRGRVQGFVALVEDVTERRRAEDALHEREAELLAAKEQAEAANRAKDRFLATLSHELRTPLAPVLAVVGALERDAGLPSKVRQGLRVIRRNVELESRLIDDLLDLTRIVQGKLELQREVVDLNQVIASALETVRLSEGAGEREVRTRLAEGPAPVWADPGRLTQVLCNLLHNAFKFTPPGGRVEVAARREGSTWTVVVTDNGRGIEPERLAGIFGAFEQGGPEVSRRFGGLGLGLAISRVIVDLHGGELAAASAGRGRGAELTLRLPADLPEAAGQIGEVQPGAAAEGVGSLSILLVEDHEDTAEAMAELLAILGHRVTAAASVAAALAAAERAGEEGFDFVISDLGLPDGSGLEVMRHLGGRVPGIALSGYGMEEDVRRSREAGFERHLTKPVSLDVLERTIREVAGARNGTV